MRLSVKHSGLILLILFFTSVAQAEPYIGFSVGSSRYDVDFGSFGDGSFDDTATGNKIYGGYDFNSYFSAELAYYNFAKASVGGVVINNTLLSGSVDTNGIAAFAVASYSLSKKFKLAAKLGVLDWRADLRVNNNTANNDGTDLAYGLLASYNFTKQLALQAEWERFETDNPELSLISVGFKFNFN